MGRVLKCHLIIRQCNDCRTTATCDHVLRAADNFNLGSDFAQARLCFSEPWLEKAGTCQNRTHVPQQTLAPYSHLAGLGKGSAPKRATLREQGGVCRWSQRGDVLIESPRR